MKDFWKTFKLGMYVFALPLVATAAASAHQWMTDSQSVSVPEMPVVSTVTDGTAVASLRNHTISLDQSNNVSGRIVSFDSKTSDAIGLGQLSVYFIQNGSVAVEVTTDADGSFTAEGLKPGPYSFIATGETGFAAYGVNVVEGEGSNVMEAAAVSPQFTKVREILSAHVPKKVADKIVSNASKTATVRGGNRVRLTEQKLSGNVVSILGEEIVPGTFVHIIKDDQQLASVEVDSKGAFQIPDMAPGVYDFVAAGPNGFAAVSFEAVQDAELSGESLIEETVLDMDTEVIPTTSVVEPVAALEPVAQPQDFISADIPMDGGYGYSNSLDVALTAPQDGYYVGDSIDYACDSCGSGEIFSDYSAPPIEYAGEAVGCGCASGASCGGGGNFSGYSNCCGGGGRGGLLGGLFGGGGNFGRLLALGGLAAGIVAIADDDNNVIIMSPQ